MIKTLEIKTEEQKKSASRSSIYIAFSRVFTFPNNDYINRISSGSIQDEFLPLVKEIPFSITYSNFLTRMFRIENIQDFQSDYIRIFDVLPGGPPCPLYEGLYYMDRRKIMEDLMRFYEHFGLKPAIKKNELPDHISMELEFMHFLTFKETQALSLNKDNRSILRAERDFLERHLASWIPKIITKFDKVKPHEYYIELYNFLNEFLKLDLEYVKGRLALTAACP